MNNIPPKIIDTFKDNKQTVLKIQVIKSKEQLEAKMNELSKARATMFLEPPFSNPSITDDNSKKFFEETFEQGYVFIIEDILDGTIKGFRTMINTNFYKEKEEMGTEDDNFYLSTLYIKKEYRKQKLGSTLMDYSLNFIKRTHNTNKAYVRTREDTPEIHALLEKTGFKKTKLVERVFNNVTTKLFFWEMPLPQIKNKKEIKKSHSNIK